jgi:hypothetical protein
MIHRTSSPMYLIRVTWGKRFRGSFDRPSNITVTWGKRFRGSFDRPSNITVTWGKRFRGSFNRPSNITVTWGKKFLLYCWVCQMIHGTSSLM